jgi:tetratricopeptide (TPR) repeat protein
MAHYARGVAFAALGRADEAMGEAAAIERIEQSDLSMLTGAGIPAAATLQIARGVIAGRVAQARGDYGGAVAAFAKAAALQDGLAYMEPPYWYYPVRQSLGAALLQAGKPAEAEAAFRAALQQKPNNGWAIFGLVEAAKARGDGRAQQEAEARLARTWVGDRSLLSLDRL